MDNETRKLLEALNSDIYFMRFNSKSYNKFYVDRFVKTLCNATQFIKLDFKLVDAEMSDVVFNIARKKYNGQNFMPNDCVCAIKKELRKLKVLELQK